MSLVPYAPTDWVDGTTPLDEAHLEKIEQGIADATDAVIALEALPALPDPTGEDEKWLKVEGGAMLWAPLEGGGGGLDWEGTWVASTPYVKGDVVTKDGVVYGAVNDSTGQTPPPASAIPVTFTPISLVTSLPTPLFDGQEVIFVDSLTAPTYSWRLRYVAAKASNKWVCIGGSPAFSEVVTAESTASTTYVDLATVGPSVVIPVAGDYVVGLGFQQDGGGGGIRQMSFAIGATAAVDADSVLINHASGLTFGGSRETRKTLTPGTLTAKYKITGGTYAFSKRYMRVLPQAVGG